MFEGKLPRLPHGHDSEKESASGEGLRELTWSDLRSRLEAARDLRASLDRAGDGEEASFDSLSARRIASQADGKDGGNPSDLTNGKVNGAIGCPSHDVPADMAPRN